MFRDKHVRKLIKECIKDLRSKPFLTFLYYTGPIRDTIERQALPLISAAIIDGFTSNKNGFAWQIFVFWFVIVNIFTLFLLFINRYAWHKLDEHITTERFPRYIMQILNFPYELIIDRPRGDIMNKLRMKVEYAQGFSITLHGISRITINLVITFLIIFYKNVYFAIAYLVFWIFSSIALYYIAKSRIEINKIANAANDEYFGKIADIVGNLETSLQFGNKNHEYQNIYIQGKELWSKFTLRWVAARRNHNLISSMQTGMNILLAVFGIWSVFNGDITIGTYVLLQTYINFALGDIVTINDILRTFVESTTRAISLDELEDKYPALPEPAHPIMPDNKIYDIEFKNVNFKYSDGNDSALKDLNLNIKNGQKVGIVGKSGAGKTTITKLLLRMYLPDSGEILIGGKSTFEMGSENTRKCIAYVPQEPILFHRSIKENIAYAAPEANDKLIEKVAKQAHCTDFINKITDGFDAKVGDKGVKLSGGQRQRVAIARAILKNSPVLIFDEATSALDSESEAIIQDALKNVMKNKTSIVIAHRLSTLKHMDRIVVIDDGRVVEDGTHQDLLEKDGIYANLWAQQSNGLINIE